MIGASLTYKIIFLRHFLPVYQLNFAEFWRFHQKSLNRSQQELPCSIKGKLPDAKSDFAIFGHRIVTSLFFS